MEIILIVVAVAYMVYLHHRLQKVESDVKILKSHQGVRNHSAAPAVQPTTDEGNNPPATFAPHSMAPDRAQAAMSEDEQSFDPIAWIREDFFVKLGALMLLLAFGWFVSYAFANNWIGPVGRITLGLVAGAGIMVLGVWRIRAQRHQGAIFTVLGSAVVILTIYAAREIYDFFTPATALGMMFMSVVFVAFVSVQYRSERLALAGLLLAAAAPLLTAAPEPSLVGLFSYLMVIVLGTLWVVYLLGATMLTPAALLVVSFYSFPFLLFSGFSSDAHQMNGLLFAFAFTAIFFLSNVMSIIHKRDPGVQKGHIVTALLTGLYVMVWIALAAAEEWHSLLYVAWMMVFAIGAFVVYVRSHDRAPFYIYGGVGVALLAAATAAELSGSVLTVAYTIEVALLIGVARFVLKDAKVATALSWLFIGPGLLSLEHLDTFGWPDSVVNEHSIALVVLMLGLFATGTVFLRTAGGAAAERLVRTGAALCILGGLYFLLLVWLGTHHALADDTATTLSLVLYTIIGLGLYIRGRLSDVQTLRILGGIVIGFVIGWLLLIEVWQMALAGKIITFFLVGVMLISTAFIGKANTKSE